MSASSGGAEAQYFSALAKGQFLLQWCGQCRKHIFYPRQFCPSCLCPDLEWVEAQGTGTVHSSTTVRLKKDQAYDVSLIDLDEGVRLMSRVDTIAPEAVRIGMRVQARVIQENAAPLLVFVPLEDCHP